MQCKANVSRTQVFKQPWAVWLLVGVACIGSYLFHTEGLLCIGPRPAMHAHLQLQILQGCAPIQVLDATDVVAGKGGHLQASQPLQVLQAPDAQSQALQVHHVSPPVRAPVPQLLAGAVPWQPGQCWSDQLQAKVNQKAQVG